MPVSCYDFPPDFTEHWSSLDRPILYYYFLGGGALCVVIIWCLMIPRIITMYRLAVQQRDKQEKIFMPLAYGTCLLFLLFPVIASILKYIIFLAPIAAYTVEFIIAVYESAVLYCFTTMIMMYLGSINLMDAFKSSTPTKFYAAPPLACCFAPCIPPTNMSLSSFHKLYLIILQYCVLLPLFQFALLVRGYKGASWAYQILNICKVASLLLCFYGLFALLIATHEILHQHDIHAKFWCIKGLIIIMLLPPVIIEYIEPLPGTMNRYNHVVMIEAYSAMVSLLLLVPLVFLFRKYITPECAYCAMYNAQQKDYTASDEYIKVGYWQLEAQNNVVMFEPNAGLRKSLVSKSHGTFGDYSHLKRHNKSF